MLKRKYLKLWTSIILLLSVSSCGETIKEKMNTQSINNLSTDDVKNSSKNEIVSFLVGETNLENHYNCQNSLDPNQSSELDDLYCIDSSFSLEHFYFGGVENGEDTVYIKSNFSINNIYITPQTQQLNVKNIIHFAHLGDLNYFQTLLIDNQYYWIIFNFENGKRIYIENSQNAHFKVGNSSLFSNDEFRNLLISQCQNIEMSNEQIAGLSMISNMYSCMND
ncbi:MAG: hypothetical protein H6622_16115 [Halobacteriovoraceae bacterium]|nr:hypothetical protein [Halobacteriovoraceae bacterium]